MASIDTGFKDIAKAKSAVRRIFPIVDRTPLIDASLEPSEDEPSSGKSAEGQRAAADSKKKAAAAGRGGNSQALVVTGGEGGAAADKELELLEPAPESVKGSVSFVEVGFSYPSRPDVTIFRGFSLEV